MPGFLSRWMMKRFRPAQPPRSQRPALKFEQLECRDLPASQGIGTGLVADYFRDAGFTALATTRTDASVDFNWGSNGPAAGLPTTGYSVRWTGQLQAQFNETYTFSVAADEGVRLWVNGRKIIDSTGVTTTGEWSGSIVLTAGTAYDLKLEYADTSGPAKVRLSWVSPSTPKEVIPTSQLYPAGGWLDQNLGTSTGGTLSGANGVYTVGGTGLLGGTADQGHFAYQGINRDGVVIAQLDSQSAATAQSGVMLRAGTGLGDAFAALTVLAGQGVMFQSRGTTGASISQTSPIAAGSQPWLKLIRNGPLVSGYVSSTGTDGTWKLVGTASVTLDRAALGGLISGSSSGIATGTFNNVNVTASVPMGANIDALDDWSLANVFVDIMKQGRTFAKIDGSGPATTDANGWPTQDFYTILQSGFVNTAHVYNGVYKLSFTGTANVSMWAGNGSVSNVHYNAATNQTTADVTLSAGDSDPGWYFGLNFQNVDTGVQNVKLIRPGYDPNTTQTFTNQFLQTIAPFSTLRFMDFTQTNDNPVVNWADRARPTDATQSSNKGVAWEYVIQLANETGKDLWINVPFGATDDYVHQLATLIKSQLNPDRAVYVEYSNELWNGGFSQSQANLNAAVAEVQAGIESGKPSNLASPGETTASQWDWAFRRTARRIVEISNDFASVWGQNAINTRIRPVLATQMAVPYVLQTQLQFIQQTFGDPSRYLYADAGAPYFAVGQADQQTNLTTDQVLSALSAAVDANDAVIDQTAAISTYYGLDFMAYEGGPDTFGPNNVAAKKAASLDPRMQALTARYVSDWYARGGDLFNWFMAGPTNYDTQYGTWGLTNDVTNLKTPKALGVQQVLDTPRITASNGTAVSGEVLAKNYVGATPTTDPYPRYLQNGNTLDYLVNVPRTGTYQLQIRYAAVNPGGQLQILVNNQDAGTLTLPVTGPDYDSKWSPNDFADSVPLTVKLEQGLNVVRLNVVSAGYTLYSLKFDAPPAGNLPPPVNQPPAVTGSGPSTSVTGTTAHLSAVGTDDGGEPALTYVWSMVSGPAAATFSSSGSNVAKATTATFTQSGSYVLRVTATDAGGLSASSDVPVAVTQTLTSLSITPGSTSLPRNGLQQFSATGQDQFGRPMTLSSTGWTLKGVGSISSTGAYVASSVAGSATVRVWSGGKSASSNITVTSASLTSLASLTHNGSATMVGSRLRLANSRHQAGSAFTQARVGVAQFNTSFHFQLISLDGNWASIGNGITFAIQNEGPTALGNWNAGQGVAGVSSGVAIRYDAVNRELAVDSGGQTINRVSLIGTAIRLRGGDVFSSSVSYNGQTLSVTLSDVTTGATITLKTVIDVVHAIGGAGAYAGFTAGTGTTAGHLGIIDWAYAGR